MLFGLADEHEYEREGTCAGPEPGAAKLTTRTSRETLVKWNDLILESTAGSTGLVPAPLSDYDAPSVQQKRGGRMKRTWAFVLPVSAAMLFLACQQGEAPGSAASPGEAPAAASTEPETGPDPTVVDADHYTVDRENDRFRVVRIRYGPAEESVMHYHPEGVAVYLTAAHGSFEMPDGSTQPADGGAGQSMLTPAGQHLPRNLGDEPFEVIQVELKGSADQAGEPAEAETGPDPTVVDPDHYTVEHENERLRVVHIEYGPGEESVMHYHPAGMAVFLTAAHGSFEMPDGSTQKIEAEAGQTMLLDAGQHLPRNLGDEPFEVVQVELKD